MRIGTSIVVAAIGAILTFAVTDHISGVDLRMIGIILMIAGVLGLLLEIVFFAPRRRGVIATTASTYAATVTAPAVSAPVVSTPVAATPLVAAPPVEPASMVVADPRLGQHQAADSPEVPDQRR